MQKLGGGRMIEKMELGEFYKELRLARKLKQSDVACDGLTASQLSKFELGQTMLSALAHISHSRD